MKNPVIVDAIRSPMARAKPDGALAQLHPVGLLSQVLQQLVGRNKIDPGQVDDVICGCVSQAGEQAGTPGRLAWLGAGLPTPVLTMPDGKTLAGTCRTMDGILVAMPAGGPGGPGAGGPPPAR